MIKASELIARFIYALENAFGYIWGASGQMWTQAKQDAATREQTVAYGQQWVGHYVTDCSGLFVWAFKFFGAYIYHGSNTIWNKYCSRQGKLSGGQRCDGIALRPGTAMFLLNDTGRHHIGLYIGDNTVIEAKGTKWGVKNSTPAHWDEWGELKAVDYSEFPEEVIPLAHPMLKKGDRGDEVKTLQTMLNAHGYSLDVDGAFGTNTEAAVKSFQQKNGLTVDGVVGRKTWEALEADDAELPDWIDGDPVDDPDGVVSVDRDELVDLINQIEAEKAHLGEISRALRGWAGE